MECPRCGKRLTLYDAICCCVECKRYFCENEGKILNINEFMAVAKGNTNRTRDLEQDFRLGMIDREKFPEFKLED